MTKEPPLSKRLPSSPGDPKVSVVIPTRNRPAGLRRCLAALTRSSVPRHRFEVIVVRDGGQEPLDEIVGAFEDLLEIRLVPQAPSGPARARNAGAAVARGDLLAFTDDDCEPAPDWVECLVLGHKRDPDAAIGGRVCNSLNGNRYSLASQVLLEYLYLRSNPDPEDAVFFATCNLAVPRRQFLDGCSFNDSYPFAAAEDRGFCRHWKERGGRLVYAPEAVVHHAHTLGPVSFFQQHFRYGRGSRRFRKEAARATSDGAAFERPGFYLGIISEPFRRLPPGQAIAVAALLGVSQVATALGFAWELVHTAPAARSEPSLSKQSNETDPAESDPAA